MKNDVWMSVSDLMTGLMVIFLFVAISYIVQEQKQQKERETMLTKFVDSKQKLSEKLQQEFKDEIEKGDLTVGSDLTMRFERAESLFDSGSAELKAEFKEQLDNILPRYLDILLNDSHREYIKEIRIEGHTDTTPCPRLDPDPYIANIVLSQQRAVAILRYMRSLDEYKKYNPLQKKLLEHWIEASGLSYGHALDANKEEVFCL